ncbi:hypothetical protein RDI58_008714 [Solanum bulbocastanum]|uniref:Transposase MuDR plant domain-containing protein n=1 Tax=Solanum bulbocastanum TaxID=147425 RepID=A0AAN8U320_SOLBU
MKDLLVDLMLHYGDDFEETVSAPNIIHHSEAYLVECEYGTDIETESDDYQSSDDEYNFDELKLIKMLKCKEVNVDLSHYKELHPSMTFKDLNEAITTVNLYSLANFKPIVVEKSDRTRLRYKCMIGCPFVLLISQDGKGSAFKNNPQYKLKDMRKDLKDQFNLNASISKLKKAKRMALQKLHESFLDDFSKIEAYENELRLSNPDSDIVINLSKDALEQGKRKFLRMYICFNALKLGWKEGEQGATFKRKKGRTEEESEEEPKEEVEEAHGEDYDVNSSSPRPTQDEEYHFMSTPRLSQ